MKAVVGAPRGKVAPPVAASEPVEPPSLKTSPTAVVDAKYHFTEAEKVDIGTRLVVCHERLRELDLQRKASAAEFKSHIDAEAGVCDSLVRKLRNGWEMRPTKCLVIYRPKDGKKDFVDANGMTVRTDEMTKADYERELPGLPDKADESKSGKGPR